MMVWTWPRLGHGNVKERYFLTPAALDAATERGEGSVISHGSEEAMGTDGAAREKESTVAENQKGTEEFSRDADSRLVRQMGETFVSLGTTQGGPNRLTHKSALVSPAVIDPLMVWHEIFAIKIAMVQRKTLENQWRCRQKHMDTDLEPKTC